MFSVHLCFTLDHDKLGYIRNLAVPQGLGSTGIGPAVLEPPIGVKHKVNNTLFFILKIRKDFYDLWAL